MSAGALSKLISRFCLLVFCCFGLAPVWPIAAASAEQSDWVPLFNGKDLTGWQVPNPNPFWRVVDGVFIGENDAAKKGHVLYTQKAYKDFIIETEARWNGEIDSGIMLRQPELQLQIGVSRSLKKDMTCSFYTNGKEKYPEAGQAKNLEKFLKPGQWNKIRLQAQGDTFTAWLNGEKVVEYKDPRFPNPYPIGLQIHPGLVMKIEFRNIRLKELDSHN
jgi:Domain of Unknown Function (DUF1080)